MHKCLWKHNLLTSVIIFVFLALTYSSTLLSLATRSQTHSAIAEICRSISVSHHHITCYSNDVAVL